MIIINYFPVKKCFVDICSPTLDYNIIIVYNITKVGVHFQKSCGSVGVNINVNSPNDTCQFYKDFISTYDLNLFSTF